jgi:DNA processing protein
MPRSRVRDRNAQLACSTGRHTGMCAAQTLEGATLPVGLSDLTEPPERVFVRGVLPRGPRVGIVGTRHPSQEAADYARELARHLAERGVAIVSGGAEGIDAAAHEGALDVGGVTVVVAPSSWDAPFPKQHAELFERIVAGGGAHLSAFESGVVARRHQFFLRNSMLVALSHVLVVAEAPLRSGARNAARWARELGRPCFVVPSAPWNPRGLGGIQELQFGARALAAPGDILRCLSERQLHAVGQSLSFCPRRVGSQPPSELEAAKAPASRPNNPPTSQETPGKKQRTKKKRISKGQGGGGSGVALSALERRILAALEAAGQFPDDIAAATELGIAEVNHGILLLLLKGAVAQGFDGKVTSTRR